MADIYNQFKDFKSFEVVFLSNDKELQKIFCTVKSIENNSIVLNANNQKNKNVFAHVGTELQLHIYTERGIYSATSRVLLAEPGIISAEYIISYPTNSKHSQRREYFRADIPVDFEINIEAETSRSPMSIKAKTKNICGKGMSYVADTRFIDYEKIQIELFFEDKIVNTFAELVYTQPVTVKGVQKYIHAFTFTDISKKNIEFIIKKCFLHQLDLKKKPF